MACDHCGGPGADGRALNGWLQPGEEWGHRGATGGHGGATGGPQGGVSERLGDLKPPLSLLPCLFSPFSVSLQPVFSFSFSFFLALFSGKLDDSFIPPAPPPAPPPPPPPPHPTSLFLQLFLLFLSSLFPLYSPFNLPLHLSTGGAGWTDKR